MLLEGLIAVLLFGAYKRSGQKGILTSEREKIYKSALEHLTDPRGLVKLAEVYEAEGLATEGAMLRRRAELRGQNQAQKNARRAAYDKGMRSRDVEAIERLADAFEQITSTGAAEALRKHAADVRLEETVKAQADNELEVPSVVEASKEPVPTESQLEDAGLVVHTTPPPRPGLKLTDEEIQEEDTSNGAPTEVVLDAAERAHRRQSRIQRP